VAGVLPVLSDEDEDEDVDEDEDEDEEVVSVDALVLPLDSLELESDFVESFFPSPLEDFLLSVIYQPLPLKWMAGALSWRSTFSLLQLSQAGALTAENETRFSKVVPQSAQANS